MHYYDFLAELHRRTRPEAYLEIGVRNGGSLSLARCRAVGVDPAFSITAELDGDVALFRTTSDAWFAQADPLSSTGGRPFELTFIDGLHLFEYALRDFLHAEALSAASGLIVLDDVLPRSVDEAARRRHTDGWTGDVYGILQVLAEHRPDLVVVPVGTVPTGLLLVMGLDPASRVLADGFDAIVARFRRPDPQPVPPHLLDRAAVVPPARLLEGDLLDVLRDGRAAVLASAARTLGSAFAAAGA